MKISVSASNPTPLYQQIADQIKAQILAGGLQSGDALPSIRQLAEEILASVITVKRAYAELEAEGLIYTRPGLGTFVARINPEARQRLKADVVLPHLAKAVETAAVYGISEKELAELLQRAMRRKADGRSDPERPGTL